MLDGGATVSAASVDGRIVTLTTSALNPGHLYTLSVANTVEDIFDVALAANTAQFSAISSAEGSCDDGLLNGNGEVSYGAFALAGTVASDGLFVAGSDDATLAANQSLGSASILQNGADGVLLVQCPTCTNAATDFPNGTVVGSGTTFVSGGGQTVTKLDALAYDTGDDDDADLMSALGVSSQFDEAANSAPSTDSNHRSSLGGWLARPSAPGLSGVQP